MKPRETDAPFQTIYIFPQLLFFAFNFIFAVERKKRKISVDRKYTRNWQFCIYVNNTQAYLLLTLLRGGGCLGESGWVFFSLFLVAEKK